MNLILMSGTITFRHSTGRKMKLCYQSFILLGCKSVNADLRGLEVGFIPPLPTELPYMANNGEYIDEYNDEYLCRDFFVGFTFRSMLSFQIPKLSSLVKLRYMASIHCA